MAQINSISATSVSTYFLCPYQWKLKYVYKLLVQENEAFEIGKSLHTALEQYHKGKNVGDGFYQQIPNEEIIANIKKTFLTEPIDNTKINNASTVIKMFELYLKYPLSGKTKKLEYEFRMALPNINAPLHGYMDRITEDNEIIDYKTTASDFTEKDINTIQAEIYSYVMQQLEGKPCKVIFYVFNKNKVKKPGYIPQILTTQPDTTHLPDKLNKFYNNVANNNFKPCIGTHCNWCLFRESCKYKK